jgi:hypothetical protein
MAALLQSGWAEKPFSVLQDLQALLGASHRQDAKTASMDG